MGTRVSYPIEVKMKAIEMRLAGTPIKQVLEELNIRRCLNTCCCRYAFAHKTSAEIEELSLRTPRPVAIYLYESEATATHD
ncbi:hypothetical protein FOH38_08390 [Lysinibacillus fusiformis]|nr:hypothetical protein FOH38_08390 [Lysinibacillus fusiformis]